MIGCSGNQQTKTKTPKDSIVKIAGQQIDIADSKFVFKNLTDTRITELFELYNNVYYTDSTKKVTLTPLSKEEKLKLISAFLSKELNVTAEYARDWMNAYYISRQDKIGDLQPIILKIDGDDYGSVTLILLDKNNNYVSGYNIAGGMLPGPNERGDSLIVYNWRSYARLNKGAITNYDLERSDYKDTTKKVSLIDSIITSIRFDDKGRFSSSVIEVKHFTVPRDK